LHKQKLLEFLFDNEKQVAQEIAFKHVEQFELQAIYFEKKRKKK
jgi:hypothetical protein